MKMKSVVFLFVFLFIFAIVTPGFSAVNTNSGSRRKPEMAFKSWRAGRGDLNSLTFITSTETTCWLSASVGYKGGNQPNDTFSPIDPDTVKWEFSSMREGWAEAEPRAQNWSGSHPSKLSGTTSFNVVAKLSLPAHDDSTLYTISTSCTANDGNRRDRSVVHRNGENMQITVTFKAKTQNNQDVEESLKLVQDKVDQLRQEYLDLTRQIPGRGAVKDSDGNFNDFGPVFYDFGHYDVMLYEGLKEKHGAWTTKINQL